MQEKDQMTRWELLCIVFNSLVYKLFTHSAEVYEKCGGSAGWITAIFSGGVFLLVLWLLLKVYSPISKISLSENKIAAVFMVVYFALSVCYSLYMVCSALKTVVYVKSPIWFIGLFFVISAGIIVLCGCKAIRRLHSLCTIGTGVVLIAISLLSLRYADVFNLTPILGKGAGSVFLKGLSALFMFSDIVVIFFLPKGEGNYNFSKTVMTGAISAVVVNIVVVLAFSLNTSYELADKIILPLYPLTKTANLGKLPVRLDAIYQISLCSSSLLYISLASHLLIKGAITISKRAKRAGASLLCLLLCFSLCGCFDAREVEEKAYVIALGIDNGESDKYKYTFQISNPLESGGSIGAEEKGEEKSNEEKNKTVDNIIIEAADYYSAMDKLKSLTAKEVDISHIKVIVYSIPVAQNDGLAHGELLLAEREIRPGTNLCIVENAEDFLKSVNPTLEESTVRYYELYFRERDLPYAPHTELRDFVGRSKDAGYDAVVPIASENGLCGMGAFSNGVLKETLSGDEVLIYKLLIGDIRQASIKVGENTVIIESDSSPKIRVSQNGDAVNFDIEVFIKTDNPSTEIQSYLKAEAEKLLYKTALTSSDIMGLGRYIKRKSLTQEKWESVDWDTLLQKSTFSVEINSKKVKNRKNLQKN